MSDGGCIFAETPGTNLVTDVFTDVHETGNGGNAVHIVAPADPVNQYLTDGGLSNWLRSYHTTYDVTGAYSVLTVGSDSNGEALTLGQTLGAGHITLSGQDISYHIQNGAGATGAFSPKGQFLTNALCNPGLVVPEPSAYAMLVGVSLSGVAMLRRRRTK